MKVGENEMIDQVKEFLIDEMFKAQCKFDSENEEERFVALIRHHTLESVLIMIFSLERVLQ